MTDVRSFLLAGPVSVLLSRGAGVPGIFRPLCKLSHTPPGEGLGEGEGGTGDKPPPLPPGDSLHFQRRTPTGPAPSLPAPAVGLPGAVAEDLSVATTACGRLCSEPVYVEVTASRRLYYKPLLQLPAFTVAGNGHVSSRQCRPRQRVSVFVSSRRVCFPRRPCGLFRDCFTTGTMDPPLEFLPFPTEIFSHSVLCESEANWPIDLGDGPTPPTSSPVIDLRY